MGSSVSRVFDDRPLPRAQALAERAASRIRHILHIEASSGIVLLLAAATALIWANSPVGGSYQSLWHLPLSFGLAGHSFSQSLHFWINDGLMTVFFLVVGMEVRREMHEGALKEWRQAMLPVGAAAGGVAVPAMLYLVVNAGTPGAPGWGVPTATDIAFAVGVLALLGSSVPGNVRVMLLALAIIDDVIAILIIAVFYSGGLQVEGFAIAALGVLIVLGFQRLGIGSAFPYLLPGAVVWIGLLMTGAHPTLAGVVLGLLTPVRPIAMREAPTVLLNRTARRLTDRPGDVGSLMESRESLRVATRELVPPVVRVGAALHPWVAFGIMPLFALANAGVVVKDVDLGAAGASFVAAGVAVALVIGKPVGVVFAIWLMLTLKLCKPLPGVSWADTWLLGILAGIGFTMSIFIATLAFPDPALLDAAKLGVLLASVTAAGLGLAWGSLLRRRRRPGR